MRVMDTDYYLTARAFANSKSKMDGMEWKYLTEQSQSIRAFVASNPELTLFYRRFH